MRRAGSVGKYAYGIRGSSLVMQVEQALGVGSGALRGHGRQIQALAQAMAALLDGGNPEDATIPFCLVSDDNGIDFEDVGFFELKLTDIYKHGDYVDRRVEVLDRNDVPIGRVAVSVVAQKALQSIALTR